MVATYRKPMNEAEMLRLAGTVYPRMKSRASFDEREKPITNNDPWMSPVNEAMNRMFRGGTSGVAPVQGAGEITSRDIPPPAVGASPSAMPEATPEAGGERTFLGLTGKDIMKFGLNMMAASSQPGADTFGSIGSAGGAMFKSKEEDELQNLKNQILMQDMAYKYSKAQNDENYRNAKMAQDREYQQGRLDILKNKTPSNPEDKAKMDAYFKLLAEYQKPDEYGDVPTLAEAQARASQATGYSPTGNAAPPAAPTGGSPDVRLQQAKDAIAKGAPRDKVIEQLKNMGINASGL